MKNRFYSLEKVSESDADLYIYGDIVSYRFDDSEVSANSLKSDLELLGELSNINVHINSYGGDTFQGLAIYNLLKKHNAKVNIFVDGIAASSASIIAMAGDKVYMPRTSLMMIHNCWTYAIGNAEELRKVAEDMDKIAEAYKSAYMSKVNISKDKLDELLTKETYLTADECIQMGFADEILEDEKFAVNSYANKSILNLVQRLKESETKNECKNQIVQTPDSITITAGLLNLTDVPLTTAYTTKAISDRALSNVQEENNNLIKEDAWTSFFNTKKIMEVF